VLFRSAESVRELGRRLGAAARGGEVAGHMEERIADVQRAVAGRRRPRVFLAEWLDPPFAPGHWLPELVEAAGGESVLGTPGEHSRETTWAAVADADPELVVLAPCGFDAVRAAREWELATACRVPDPLQGIAVAVDANAFFSRPSPRVAEGVEILARLIHPTAFAAAA